MATGAKEHIMKPLSKEWENDGRDWGKFERDFFKQDEKTGVLKKDQGWPVF